MTFYVSSKLIKSPAVAEKLDNAPYALFLSIKAT